VLSTLPFRLSIRPLSAARSQSLPQKIDRQFARVFAVSWSRDTLNTCFRTFTFIYSCRELFCTLSTKLCKLSSR